MYIMYYLSVFITFISSDPPPQNPIKKVVKGAHGTFKRLRFVAGGYLGR